MLFLLAIIVERSEGEPIENWDQGKWATWIIVCVCWLPISTFYLFWCILPAFKFLVKERKNGIYRNNRTKNRQAYDD